MTHSDASGLHSTLKSLLSRLFENGVEFLLVGGLAVQQYVPIYRTHDIDIWVNPSKDNIERVILALIDLGCEPGELAELREGPSVVRFEFDDMTTFDLLKDISGSDLIGEFERAYDRRNTVRCGGLLGRADVLVDCLSIDDLLVNKLTAGREKDLKHVQSLLEAKRFLERRAEFRLRKAMSPKGGPPKPNPPRRPDRDPAPDSDGPSPTSRPRPFLIWRNEPMLSIAKVAGGGGYLQYLAGEYYLEEAKPGLWMGSGAEAIGLEGEVSERAFRRVAAGFSPKGKKPKPLVRNAGAKVDQKTGTKGHVQGWDLTFSAPKPVSVLWGLSDEATRQSIAECHRQAVKDALDYLESEAAWSRRGKGGAERVKARLVVAGIGHGTNRELEPQLHDHEVVMNVCVGVVDGKTATLDSRYLYRHKMTAGALYQASLAAQLAERLGVAIQPEKVGFGIDGIRKEVCERFSTRRKQILEALRPFGSYSPEAAAVAAQRTKREKEARPTEHLSAAWREVAAELGFTQADAKAALGVRRYRAPSESVVQEAIRKATDKLLEQQSHFSEQDLLRQTARQGIGTGVNARAIRDAVKARLGTAEYVQVGELKEEKRFTTKAVLAQEQAMIADAEKLSASRTHAVRPHALRRKLEDCFPTSGRHLTEDQLEKNKEQRAAVEHLLDGGNFKLLSGMAGTGKSTALKVCREVWEKSGYTVLGAAVAGKAARGLQESSGIESNTLAGLLVRLEATDTPAGMLKLHATNMWRVARGKPPYQPFWLKADTVVVVDEAGMVGTSQMAKLLHHVQKAGAKLVAVGDEAQLQPVDAGGPFAHFIRRFDAARITNIVRQSLDPTDKDPAWKRKAVKEFAAGQAEDALAKYAERGLVTVKKNRDLAREVLVSDWLKAGGLTSPKEHLIFASTNEDVRQLNRLCQLARGNPPASEVMRKGVKTEAEEVILPGDRVLFTKRSRPLHVENGDLGTVRDVVGKFGRKVMVVDLDSSKEAVQIPTGEFSGFRLGYAMTTHKGQGVTCKNAYILAGGPMQDRHLTYVQASRAVEKTRFYVDRYEAGPRLSQLAEAASQDRTKDLAHDLLEPKAKQSVSFAQVPVG